MAQATISRAENGTGQDVLDSFNELVSAGMTNNSGSTPPPDPEPGMPWNLFQDPEWGKAVRSKDNGMWLYTEVYDLLEPPGAQRNEAAGYRVGSKCSTQDGRVYWHTGGGIWQQLGTGAGGAGSGSGSGVFYGMTRFINSDDQLPLMMNYSGQSRFKTE